MSVMSCRTIRLLNDNGRGVVRYRTSRYRVKGKDDAVITLELDPAVRPLAFLVGTWRGEGAGDYPTIRPFRYREEIRYWHTGKPFLIYTQRTNAADDGRPLHTEMGYLRGVSDGRVELVVAQHIGFAEISVGSVRDNRIQLKSLHLGRTPTAKAVTGVERDIWLEGDTLRYELRMAMETVPLTKHLQASFQRTAD